MSNDSAEIPPSLQADVQPSTVRLGDLLTLTIQAQHAPGGVVQPPALPHDLGTFEVHASTALPSEQNGPIETQRFLVELQNFTTGQQVVPPLGFTYRGANGHVYLLQTPTVTVQIEMVKPGPQDKGDIRGIKGVIGPVALSPGWWLVLVFAVLVAGVAWWSHRRKMIAGPPPEPPVPADTTALAQLQELLAKGWLESGKMKEFYIAVSEIVRSYLETGFQIPALERTTGELLRDVRKQSKLDSPSVLQLKELLEECDLVKFAKFRPEAGEALKVHAMAVQFVTKTQTALKDPA